MTSSLGLLLYKPWVEFYRRRRFAATTEQAHPRPVKTRDGEGLHVLLAS